MSIEDKPTFTVEEWARTKEAEEQEVLGAAHVKGATLADVYRQFVANHTNKDELQGLLTRYGEAVKTSADEYANRGAAILALGIFFTAITYFFQNLMGKFAVAYGAVIVGGWLLYTGKTKSARLKSQLIELEKTAERYVQCPYCVAMQELDDDEMKTGRCVCGKCKRGFVMVEETSIPASESAPLLP